MYKNISTGIFTITFFNNNKIFPSVNFINLQFTAFKCKDSGIAKWQTVIKPFLKLLILIIWKSDYA